MTIDETAMLLDALAAAFPRSEMSGETAQVYVRFLADLDFDRGATAVATHIAEGKWFPTISELRARAFADRNGPDPDQAWGEVLLAVARYGAYRSPTFSHPAITAAVGSLTWREICASDNAPALRAHFAKTYELCRGRIIADERTEFIKAIVAELPRRAIAGAERKRLKT